MFISPGLDKAVYKYLLHATSSPLTPEPTRLAIWVVWFTSFVCTMNLVVTTRSLTEVSV